MCRLTPKGLILSLRTIYQRQGPCLTEVSFTGNVGTGITHSSAVSLARTDDIVRGVYQLRMDVNEATDFSRFVIFQIGADTYSYSGALCRANQGVMEFVEMFKAPIKVLHPLLTATQEGNRRRNRDDSAVVYSVGRRHLPHGAHRMHRSHPLGISA